MAGSQRLGTHLPEPHQRIVASQVSQRQGVQDGGVTTLVPDAAALLPALTDPSRHRAGATQGPTSSQDKVTPAQLEAGDSGDLGSGRGAGQG